MMETTASVHIKLIIEPAACYNREHTNIYLYQPRRSCTNADANVTVV